MAKKVGYYVNLGRNAQYTLHGCQKMGMVKKKAHPFWDGKINGEFAETGTYFFTLKYQRLCGDNEPVLKEGAVWLQR